LFYCGSGSDVHIALGRVAIGVDSGSGPILFRLSHFLVEFGY